VNATAVLIAGGTLAALCAAYLKLALKLDAEERAKEARDLAAHIKRRQEKESQRCGEPR
jgi:hypothetical protein